VFQINFDKNMLSSIDFSAVELDDDAQKQRTETNITCNTDKVTSPKVKHAQIVNELYRRQNTCLL
jgi:hypothetical protein